MTFASPWWLILLPLCLWIFFRKNRRATMGVPSVDLWNTPGGGRSRFLFLVPLFQALACSLVVIALARPQAGAEKSIEIRRGIAIEMLVDVSSSMDMAIEGRENEKSQTRMEVAKELVERFIAGDGATLKGRSDDLVGLITFARYADTRSPLTSGHDALVQIVRGLEIQDRPNEDGTAYGDALALAAARLAHLEDTMVDGGKRFSRDIASKIIILLTDGENNSGKHLPEEAGGLSKNWGIKIYSISLGEGSSNGSNYEELSAAEQLLEHISKETGGIFRQAEDYESLASVYGEIDRLERSDLETKSLDHREEMFWMPLAAALFLFLPALCLEATWLRTAP